MTSKLVVTNDVAYLSIVLADTIPKDPRFILIRKKEDKNKNIKYECMGRYDATFCKETLIHSFKKSREQWSIDKTHIGVIQSTIKQTQDTNDKKLLFKKAIQIINMIERKHGWPLTKMKLFTRSQIHLKGSPGTVRAYEERYKKEQGISNRSFMVGVFEPSSVWYQYNHTLSLFLSLVRLSINGVYSNVASYPRFIKRNAELRKQACRALKNKESLNTIMRETTHITYSNVWPAFLEHMDKIYTSKDIDAFKLGKEDFTVGINTFICKFWYQAVRNNKMQILKTKGLNSETPNFPSEKEIVTYCCSDNSDAAKRLLRIVTKNKAG